MWAPYGARAAIEQTPDGRRIVVRRDVDAPADTVWDVLTDTEQWHAWGPSVSDVECDDQYIDAGTTGRVRVADAAWFPFEVTSCESYRWTWTVARLNATGHRVEPGPSGTVVAFEIPPLAAGYVPVCARACARIGELVEERERQTE
ncbi:SRPBCC family protein [Haloarcula halophila]|uniref:SRPBCC family protein n=1 Tax=Haloarcula TaxID=2237 RepID=UPI0023E3AD86|nr:SRPBCC family protein [Halomicroarcula sp. DFY41]